MQLRFLDIASNRINSIPDFVGIRLKRLEVLNAAANQLVVIPASLCRETSHLKKLVLINNRIEHLPCFIYRLQGLRVLKLEGNPLKTPSSEFVRRRGIPGIFGYAMETKDRADAVAETMTVLLMGDRESGKTGIAAALW